MRLHGVVLNDYAQGNFTFLPSPRFESRRSMLWQTGIELDTLTCSEWDMPRQGCFRIQPVSFIQKENETCEEFHPLRYNAVYKVSKVVPVLN
jgi:hypothetical protein